MRQNEKCCDCGHRPGFGTIEPIGSAPYTGGACRLRGRIVKPNDMACHGFMRAIPKPRRSVWQAELEQRGPATGGLFGREAGNG
jgi:hypothetical protein